MNNFDTLVYLQKDFVASYLSILLSIISIIAVSELKTFHNHRYGLIQIYGFYPPTFEKFFKGFVSI